MKKAPFFLLFCLFILRGPLTAQNIYQSIGKTTEVLTLSNGQYQEIFPNDTIVHIGSVLFNTVTHKIVAFVESNEEDSSAVLMETSRFLSIDPLGRKYPELTPYQFASNRPIQGVDLDGLEFFEAPSGQLSQMKKVSGTTHVETEGKIEKTIYMAKDLIDKTGWIMETRNLEGGPTQTFHYAEDTKNTQASSYWRGYDQFSYNKTLGKTADAIAVGTNVVAGVVISGGLLLETGASEAIGVGLRHLGNRGLGLLKTGGQMSLDILKVGGRLALNNAKNPGNIASAVSDVLTQTITIMANQGSASDFNFASTASQLFLGGKYSPYISSLVGNSIKFNYVDGGLKLQEQITNDPLAFCRNAALGVGGNFVGGLLGSNIPGAFGQGATPFLMNTFGNVMSAVAAPIFKTPSEEKSTGH